MANGAHAGRLTCNSSCTLDGRHCSLEDRTLTEVFTRPVQHLRKDPLRLLEVRNRSGERSVVPSEFVPTSWYRGRLENLTQLRQPQGCLLRADDHCDTLDVRRVVEAATVPSNWRDQLAYSLPMAKDMRRNPEQTAQITDLQFANCPHVVFAHHASNVSRTTPKRTNRMRQTRPIGCGV